MRSILITTNLANLTMQKISVRNNYAYKLVEPLKKYDVCDKALGGPIRLQEYAGIYLAASADIE